MYKTRSIMEKSVAYESMIKHFLLHLNKNTLTPAVAGHFKAWAKKYEENYSSAIFSCILDIDVHNVKKTKREILQGLEINKIGFLEYKILERDENADQNSI